MDNEKIICNECGTENEGKYEYCKNCGAKLNKPTAQTYTDPFTGYAPSREQEHAPQQPNHTDYTQQPPNSYGYTSGQPNYQQNAPFNGNTYVETIEGIPYNEVATFIGKKADKYLPVFSKMEITTAKTAWHWPIALLSFFFGPLGSALWFFYRKMYKHAVVFAIIGVILTVATSLMLGPEPEINFEDFYSSFSQELLAEEEYTPMQKAAEAITGISEIASAVICGIFTHYWYKKHIHNKITTYRTANVDPRYYQMGLASIGGTSGGMLALGFVIMIIIPSSITEIIYFLI